MKALFSSSIFTNNPFVQGFRDGMSREDDGMYDDMGHEVHNDIFDWGFAAGQMVRHVASVFQR